MALVVVATADEEAREALVTSFRSLGHEVLEVAGARACLVMVEARPPGALVLDPRLPGLEGSGLLHRLRRSASLADTRVSLLAQEMDSDLWEFLARQMFDFVIEDEGEETGALGLDAVAPRPERSRKGGATRTKTLPPPPPAEGGSGTPPRRILVVEDEPTYGILLGTEFQALGWTTLCAASAEAALEMLRGERVDAILCDINLPGMEGDDLALKIRKENPSVKVVLMTGMPRDQYPQVPDEIPILPKPINVRELMRAMRFLKQS